MLSADQSLLPRCAKAADISSMSIRSLLLRTREGGGRIGHLTVLGDFAAWRIVTYNDSRLGYAEGYGKTCVVHLSELAFPPTHKLSLYHIQSCITLLTYRSNTQSSAVRS